METRSDVADQPEADQSAACPQAFRCSTVRDGPIDVVWTYPTRSRNRHAEIMVNLPVGIRGIVLRLPAEVAKFRNNLLRSRDLAACRHRPANVGYDSLRAQA
jgi:hypothetical protein